MNRSRRPGFRQRLGRLPLALALAVVAIPISAAVAGDPPAASDPATWVVDGTVRAVERAGERTIIGGNFDHVGKRVGAGVAFQTTGAGVGTPGPGWPAVNSAGFPEVAGGEVSAVVADGAGGWFIGGGFSSVGGLPRSRLAHILADGAVDPAWSASANDEVLALALDGAGNLYVGGKFTSLAGAARSGLGAVNATTGAALAWSPDLAGGEIHALAVKTVAIDVTEDDPPVTQTRSMPIVFAGGIFTNFGGQSNADNFAAIWGVGAAGRDGAEREATVLANPSGSHSSGVVSALVVGAPVIVPDGGGQDDIFMIVYTGGAFTSPENRVAAMQLKLDAVNGPSGAATPSFSNRSNWNGNGAGGDVHALVLHTPPAGVPTLYLGGDFTGIGQTNEARAGLAALTPVKGGAVTGSCSGVDCTSTVLAWAPEPAGAGGVPPDIRGLAAANGDDAVFVAGDFATIGSGAPAARVGLAALAASGATAEGEVRPLDPKLAGGNVSAVAVNGAGSSVYAGGSFSAFEAVARKNLAALDGSGALDPGWQADTDAEVLALAAAGEDLYVGGSFSTIGAVARDQIAALDVTTGAPRAWNPGVGCEAAEPVCGPPPKQPTVNAIALSQEAVYVGGAFTELAGALRRGAGAVFPIGATDGISGADISGTATGWDPQALDSSGKASQVHAVEVACNEFTLPGDVVYAGGSFDSIGGAALPRLAALDTASGSSTGWDPRAGTGAVRALAAAPDTSVVYAGGGFSVIGQAVRQKIAALGAADGKATSWNPNADQDVRALDLSGDGETVLAGGSFNSIGGANRNRLAALEANGIGDGSGDATAWNPAPTPQPGGTVYAVRASADNAYVGGEFTGIGSRAQRGVASFSSGPDAGSTLPDCRPPPPAPPAVTIESGPTGTVGDRSATLSFSFAAEPEPGTTFQCSLDAGPYEECSSPVGYRGLVNGDHSVAIRGRGFFGNVGPETTWGWAVHLPNEGPCSNPVRGTPDSDELTGTAFGEEFRTGGADDRVNAVGGDDCIYVGDDNDWARGGDGDDLIDGGKGFDRLKGDKGNDKVIGGLGRDRLRGGKGRDRLIARDGRADVVKCGRGRKDFARVDRKDKVRGCERVKFGRGGRKDG